jgi:hypothetical protein
MIIPQLQGNFNQENFFIYAACDEKYFDEFGKTLIESIQRNSKNPIHIHLFNPRDDQLQYCREKSVSTTYETVSIDDFSTAAKQWDIVPSDGIERIRYERIMTSMSKGGDKTRNERLMKTYFACARFIRLAEILITGKSAFSMDIDAIFRKELPELSHGPDFYVRKNKQYLAGGLYLTSNPNSLKFLKEYAALLRESIERDYIYWSLDQDILDILVPKYQTGELPLTFIDWYMKPESYIWTAKGKRKDLAIFINEQKKYRP